MSAIIITLISSLISNFLLYRLNKSTGIFKPIQEDLGSLTKQTRRILNFSGWLLTIETSVLISITFYIDYEVCCVLLGFLMALVDICFKDNVVESIT